MKVLLINGGPHKDGCTNLALEEVQKTLNNQNIETEIIWLGNALSKNDVIAPEAPAKCTGLPNTNPSALSALSKNSFTLSFIKHLLFVCKQ